VGIKKPEISNRLKKTIGWGLKNRNFQSVKNKIWLGIQNGNFRFVKLIGWDKKNEISNRLKKTIGWGLIPTLLFFFSGPDGTRTLMLHPL
jgi:hypothetical protein